MLESVERTLRKIDKWLPPAKTNKQKKAKASASNLLEFIVKTNPRYKPSWYHKTICELCDRVIVGDINRLIVSLPPRHGKTEIISRRLPAYLLGRNPDSQIIATSYSADLAAKNNRDVQRIIDSTEYAAIFPNTALAGRNTRNNAQLPYLRNNDIFEIVNHRGSYRAAGVGGGITGMGFGGDRSPLGFVGGIGIIDDYLKNREEAESPRIREKIWEWYTSTFRTRCENNAPIIVIATQWHQDDLIGRLIANAKGDPKADQWTVIRFPAIAPDVELLHELDTREQGEALWCEKYPLEELDKIKSSIGDYDWNALYQCNPVPKGGSIILDKWIQKCDRPKQFKRWILSIDATFKETKSGSFVVIQCWGENYPNYYLFDQYRQRCGFVDTKAAIKATLSKWIETYGRPQAILIEDKANGSAIIDELRLEIAGILPVSPQGSKSARLESIAPYFESGNVFLPNAPWVNDYINEIISVPFAPNDDQADATSQAIAWLARSTYGKSGQARYST